MQSQKVQSEKEPRRARGRPRRYAPGRRPTLTFRVQEPIYRDITKQAAKKGRSISEEIESRLTGWTELDKNSADFVVRHGERVWYFTAKDSSAMSHAESERQSRAYGDASTELPDRLIAHHIKIAVENALTDVLPKLVETALTRTLVKVLSAGAKRESLIKE